MADVAEIIEEVPVVEKEKEKEVEKKVVDVEAEDKSNDEPAVETKEKNGLKNGESKAETNGVSEETATNKRKSGTADAPEAAVDGTPEKKAKIVAEENDESNSTNGSTEVAA